MNKGWLELESDPGLFTLLLEDFGVQGVQVEEIYDLQKPIEGPVYGFIFLFRWIEERRCRRKTITEEDSFLMDEKTVNGIFFAQQVIPNSCATHALLSVLLNNDKVKLGETLSKLKEFTKNMNPEDKGHAIGNMPELARAHNSHARPEPRHLPEKQQGISTVRTMEAFHFVSYVPVSGRLFELDGLKPSPIDHGPWDENEDWTEKFRRVISERLGMGTGGEPYHDIRFNLMAVVPDRRQQYEHKLKTLKKNKQIVLDTLQQMVKVMSPSLPNTEKVAADAKSEEREIDVDVPADTTTKDVGGCCPEGESQTLLDDVQNSSRLPSALDSHNYAKSPIFEGKNLDEQDNPQGDAETQIPSEVQLSRNECSSLSAEHLQQQHLHAVKENNVKIHIAVTDDREGGITLPKTVSSTDVTKPLKIETRFGGSSGPSSESTDTASETGSGFNSPNSTYLLSMQHSPQLNADKLGLDVPALAHGDKAVEESGSLKAVKMELANDEMLREASERLSRREMDDSRLSSSSGHGSKRRFSSRHGFTPKDLWDLLKNVEKEISTCEGNLRDEVEKRKKYRIDDCRRTHSYDQFICTFLSMLAEQGHLAELVEKHMLTKKRQGTSIGRLHKIASVTPERRRRARSKRRR